MSEQDDIVRALSGQQRQAQSVAVGWIGADPEKASRAMQLEEATGVPASAISENLEDFEQDHRAALTTELLRNNQHLQTYVNSHPMAAQVSNDDYGNLDKVSSTLKRLGSNELIYGEDPIIKPILQHAAEAFKEGFGSEPLTDRTTTSKDPLHQILNRAIRYSPISQPVLGAVETFQFGMRGISGVLHGALGGFTEYLRMAGMDETQSRRLGRDMLQIAQVGMSGQAGFHAPTELNAIAKAVKKGEPWLKAGVEPPVGIDPFIDNSKLEQARQDGKVLKEVTRDAQQSATRERAPDLFANFIRQHTGDSTIGISAEAVQKLYGEKLPYAEDGLLGWVPDLQAQLELAREHGGDVHIPLADWLARVDPKVANDLHDFVRVRRGGVSLEEGKELGKAKAELEPLAQEGEVDLSQTDFYHGTNRTFKEFKDQPGMEKGAFFFSQSPRVASNYAESRGERGAQVMPVRLNIRKPKYVTEREYETYANITPEMVADLKAQGYDSVLIKRGEDFHRPGPGDMAGDIMEAIVFDSHNIRPKYLQTVDALREQAQLNPPKGWDVIEPTPKPPEGIVPEGVPIEAERVQIGRSVVLFKRAREFLSEAEKKIVDRISAELKRIAPDIGEIHPSDRVELGGDRVRGVMTQYIDRLPEIAYTLSSEDPLGTARHEAIHVLRQGGYINAVEWEILKKAVDEGKWMDRHEIKTRYSNKNLGLLYEEAIAEEYKSWSKLKDTSEALKHPAAKIFEKIKQLLEKVKEIFQRVIGEELPDEFKNQTFEQIFERISSGEVGKREDRPLHPGAFRRPKADIEPLAQEEPAKLTSPIDPKMDPRNWMPKAQLERWMKKINERNAEDAARQVAKAEKDIRRRQTEEWKNNERTVRGEVVDDINNRPDIAADALLRSSKIKLDASKVKPEQLKLLPQDIVSRKGGISPDELAGHFGYQSGEAMVNRIAILAAQRETLKLQPKEYVNQLIKAETERRMKERFGDLDENILKEAQEHVVSDTQMDLLHEEVFASAVKAGATFNFTKADFVQWVRERFAQTKISNIDFEGYLNAAGRAGRSAEREMLADNWTEAFRHRQAQYMSMLLAKEAKTFEKEQARFEKTAKRFKQRAVKNVDPEYTNWIHDILVRVGRGVDRTVQDLAEQIEKAPSNLKTLEEFVADKEANLRELPVADFLFDPNWSKPVEQMTAAEFQAVADSVKALAKNGRDELKLIKAGEEFDLNIAKTKMIMQLQEFKERYYDAAGNRWLLGVIPPKPARLIRTYLANHLQLESLFNRWDRGDRQGVFTQMIMRELSTAANHEAKLERDFSKLLLAIKDKADLSEKIENPIFIDPLSTRWGDPGRPIPMTRKNLRAVLLNAGNEQNLKKLADGYGIKPEAIMQWLHQHATKEDWQWAQHVGDIFKEIKKMSDTMYRNLTGGVAAENIPIREIQTPHGTFEGWYYPLIAHPVWEGKGKTGGKLRQPLEQDNYVRATTPAGYTKKRTGAVYPLDLDLDRLPNQMKQMIHDIAFRPAVINASKIFYDKDVRAAITKHYGVEYTELLDPYIRDVANAANFTSHASHVFAQWSEYARQNIIATYIGLNPGTVMKHGPTAAINSLTEVGVRNFAREVAGLFSKNEQTGETNWRFAMKTSEELQRRERHYVETLRGSQEDVLRERTLRETMIAIGAFPVAKSDLVSAVPTWLAEYKRLMREGADHGEAVYEADRAVRRAHGSSVVTNRPGVMRGGPMAQWLASVYGFFSHIFNRQYELMWRSGDLLGLLKEGDVKAAMKEAPKVSWMLFSYVLLPALIEEMVSPHFTDDKESWGKKAVKIVALGTTSSWIGIRDMAHAIASKHDPSAGLLTTAMKAYTDVIRDFGSKKPSRQKAGDIIKHGLTALGAATGLANAQEGRWAKFAYDYATGQQRPRTAGHWYRIFRYGDMKERKH